MQETHQATTQDTMNIQSKKEGVPNQDTHQDTTHSTEQYTSQDTKQDTSKTKLRRRK